jgi:D-amino-acid oxidase
MSGLCCARLLVQGGHQVVLVSADPLPLTTSYLAAAVWFPTAVGPPTAVARWGAATYDVLAAEAAAGVPGVVMRESLMLYRQAEALLPPLPAWADAVGDVRAARADELPPGYDYGLRFVVPLIEMPLYLPHLWQAVLASGVRHVVRRVAALDEVLDLAPDVVVNAAGMAAGALVADDTVFPVRGQIVRVTNRGCACRCATSSIPGAGPTCTRARRTASSAAPWRSGSWHTEPDPAQTAAILARCTDIAPQLAASRVIETVVGLRPGRPEVRVELDHELLPVPVVHDYGHGGAGITIGWGCAQDVVALVEQLVAR